MKGFGRGLIRNLSQNTEYYETAYWWESEDVKPGDILLLADGRVYAFTGELEPMHQLNPIHPLVLRPRKKS